MYGFDVASVNRVIGGHTALSVLRRCYGVIGPLDSATRIVEINRVLLDADKLLAGVDAGDAGGAAAHEGVED